MSTASPMRSCALPVGAVEGKAITTIEGLAPNGMLHRVQQAWVDHDVPQCGYCQSGMIMAVAALLQADAEPDRRRDRRGDHQYLPLRHLSAGARGDPRGGERDDGASDDEPPGIDRRAFLVSVAAAGGALALGFDVPFGRGRRAAAARRRSPPGS